MPDEAIEPVHNFDKVQKLVAGAVFESDAEQLKFYFVANAIHGANQKKAVLLTNLPSETYQLVKDLVAPNLLKDSKKIYGTIVEKLQRQLKS